MRIGRCIMYIVIFKAKIHQLDSQYFALATQLRENPQAI